MTQDGPLPEQKKGGQKERGLLRCILVFFLLLSGGVAFVIGGFLWGQQKFRAPGPLAQETIVTIPKGAGLAAIAGLLERRGVIENALLFRLALHVQGRAQSLKAGDFSFPAGASSQQVALILQQGREVSYSITIPEGLRVAEVLARVRAHEFLTGELTSVPAEGTLLPDTWHVVRGERRQALVDRMVRAQENFLAQRWPSRQADLPLQTPEDAVILASIVEKETAQAHERPLVASVFLNRLRRGMRLQSDPTVSYGVTGGRRALDRPLSKKDLKTPTPYNTYLIDRLPPTPIANAGRAAIEAVLNPVKSDYFYFVADGTGGHAFARTLREHNKNVVQWRKIERQRKEKGQNSTGNR